MYSYALGLGTGMLDIEKKKLYLVLIVLPKILILAKPMNRLM